MLGFIKTTLKKIAYKVYLIGESEYKKKLNEKLPLITIQEKSKLLDGSQIDNNQGDSTKIKIGKMTWIQGHLLLFKHGGEILIGDYCYVGKDTRIWSAKNIKIGNRVLISHNVNIVDNITHPINAEERHLDFIHLITKGFSENAKLNEKEIIIEDDVWIGFNSTIMKGVTIGKGAIIGACTLITKDIPPYAVVVGNPARIIKYANESDSDTE